MGYTQNFIKDEIKWPKGSIHTFLRKVQKSLKKIIDPKKNIVFVKYLSKNIKKNCPSDFIFNFFLQFCL